MRYRSSKRKPTFFWQGLLILLPVVVMAVFALKAIVKDRVAVERESRARAQETLQLLASDFEKRAGVQLAFLHGNAQYGPRQRYVSSLPPVSPQPLELLNE